MEGVAMFKSAFAFGIGGALCAAAMLVPAGVAAKGFSFPHAGLHRGHHHHMHAPYGYGYGYVGPVATYTPDAYAQPVIVMPTQFAPAAPAAVPRCTHSRETVTVPSESGGERQITITRC
jgi:hypothetical protein